jgi:hypothetical protein
MVHSDCGAYGGLAAFGNDAQLEANYYQGELRKAARCVQEQLSAVDVQAYFVDFDSVWQVELGPPLAVTLGAVQQ